MAKKFSRSRLYIATGIYPYSYVYTSHVHALRDALSPTDHDLNIMHKKLCIEAFEVIIINISYNELISGKRYSLLPAVQIQFYLTKSIANDY